MAPGELDLSAFSGISFRKGSLQTLADGGTPSYALADAADHNTIDSTRFYVGDTVQARAARMASICDGFAPDAPRLAHNKRCPAPLYWTHDAGAATPGGRPASAHTRPPSR